MREQRQSGSSEFLDELPVTYTELLVLESGGASEAEIAGVIGIPIESVRSLADLAHRKVKGLLDRRPQLIRVPKEDERGMRS